MRCAVIIPTWQGAAWLPALIAQLRLQTQPADLILVIDSSSSDGSAEVARGLGCQVEVIAKAAFNHGGTRNRAAQLAASDLLVFMTQDALPVDAHFLERLTAPLRAGTAAASYARQIARDDAYPPERLARSWNYPATSHLRQAADIPRLGVKAFFFSNVASAVLRDRFAACGGFPDDVIMNEDMVLCARLLGAGETISYCADAVVRHSHNYSIAQQFRRYFDIGAFFASHGHLLPGSAVGAEGVRFAINQLFALLRLGRPYWMVRSLVENLAKFIAFQLGRRNRLLPAVLKRRLSMHAFHWTAPPKAP
jgi:rhamnosyltransferase